MNFDLNKKTLREVNQHLQNVDRKKNTRQFEILNPQGQHAICAGLKDLDGFYTFIAGTKDGFALLRDEIACKPAVVAETKDYVAVASEFQAMAHLPNVNSAKIFEPKPGVVYHW